ncbi:MAG: glycosyl hydrolase-related protein [Treponema sp.]|jgi:alpha-mannosidase|nr:glycosyl hydrolase-related protein [Treponema sp.]
MITINTNYRQLAALRDFEKQEAANPNYYRISGELRFLSALSDSLGGTHDSLITGAAERLAARIRKEHCTTPEAAAEAEAALASLAAEAKSFEFLCVAHAHIDMNWMWGYNETVSVTLATMETMLDMMDEYPSFTFSQSQASVYRIIEEFAPAMFEKIKRRVKEGRWEVLASTWVETDKNMPSGESLTRHLLYTKEYFAETFGLSRDDLVIDFEPDTFGHNRNVPEICNSGGVKYYYHCRGHVGDKIIYRWRSPSGKELLVYTEPFWYITKADNTAGEYAPELSRLTGTKTLLRVYGVGDHGGGPTRRDISRFIEMNSWPLYPKFTFSRLKDYFAGLEKNRDKLPLLNDEINFLCDGCYTTQTRIKAGNRKAERLMADAEFYSSAAMLWAGQSYPKGLLSEAWKKILFNQFHDIIPGSGVTETREYASALYQQVFAAAESARTLALEAVAANIDTKKLLPGTASIEESQGEGAGVGYGQNGRGAGKRRSYFVFNPLPYDREETVSVTVWDYEGDFNHIHAEDASGMALEVQKGESGNYWGHHFDTLITRIPVPSCGYTTIIIDEKVDYTRKTGFTNDMRVQSPDRFVLENEYIQAVLNPLDGSIASFIDKKTGVDLAPQSGGFGVFRLATEALRKGITAWESSMSAWFIGRFKEIKSITAGVEIRPAAQGGLRTAYELSVPFGNGSSIKTLISLDAGSRLLRYNVRCVWREFGSGETGIPNLHFHLPLSYKPDYLFDVPFGMTKRPATDIDLPAESFVVAKNAGRASSLALFSLDKYGYRCREDSLALTLIRGAIDPDPTPETGTHAISFAISPVSEGEDPARESLIYRRPVTVISGKSRPASSATLAPSGSLFSLKGGVLSALKRLEKGGKKLLFRIYEETGRETQADLSLSFPAASAWFTDATEEKRLGAAAVSGDGKTVTFKLPAYSVLALVVELKA